MEFQLFLQDIVELVRSRVGFEADVSINTVKKNNGIVLSGLCIKKKDINATPTIYMEPYYERYMDGWDIVDIADNIIGLYAGSCIKKDIEPDFFMNYEKLKDNLYCRLINYDMNKELLEDVPYGRYWDLAVVVYYAMHDSQIGEASILVRKEHVNMWNVSGDEVLKTAIANTRMKMEFIVEPLYKALIKANAECGNQKLFPEDDLSMQLVTNKNLTYGAIFMIFNDMLDDIAKQLDSDFYIIPSSVHELILLLPSEDIDSYKIDNMINEVNSTQVSREEVLSNHVYFYSRSEGAIMIPKYSQP